MPIDEIEAFYTLELIARPHFFDPNGLHMKARTESLKLLLRKYLPAQGAVLDLCCGTGAFSFLLEKMGFNVTGIELLDKMIHIAKEEAKKRSSSVVFRKGNALNVKLQSNFDAVVLLGNSLALFSVREFIILLEKVRNLIGPGGRFLFTYSDTFDLLLRGYGESQVFALKPRTVLEFTYQKYDRESGSTIRFLHNLTDHTSVTMRFHLWASWMVEPIAKLAGFNLVGRENTKMEGMLEAYEKSQ